MFSDRMSHSSIHVKGRTTEDPGVFQATTGNAIRKAEVIHQRTGDQEGQ